LRVRVKSRHCTKITPIGTATSRLHGMNRGISIPREQVTRHGFEAVKRGRRCVTINAAQLARPKILDDACPNFLRVSHYDCVGMANRFFRAQRGVHTTQNHLYAKAPKSSGNIKGPWCSRSHTGNPHQVHLFRPINLLNLFIHNLNSPIAGCFSSHPQ